MSLHEIIVHDVLPEHLEYEDESDKETNKITVNNNIFNRVFINCEKICKKNWYVVDNLSKHVLRRINFNAVKHFSTLLFLMR